MKHAWPPVQPQDEKFYNIELSDGRIIKNVEFWAFGGGFQPSEKKLGLSHLVDYHLDDIVSFELSNK
jgi:hypothetical protein